MIWALAVLAFGPAVSGFSARAAEQTALACIAQPDIVRFRYPLPRVAGALADKRPLKIVALGSSSTEGIGASSPAASYPSRLESYLRAAFPDNTITVANRGVGGDRTKDEMLRFDRDVIAEKPDLVVWQIGTNTLLAQGDMWNVFLDVRAGVARLNALGADVVLLNTQYSPRVLEKTNYEDMLDLVAVTGREMNVDVFDRFNLMKRWVQQQRYPFAAFVGPDGLHMNDWGYDCIAKLLSDAITQSAIAVSARR